MQMVAGGGDDEEAVFEYWAGNPSVEISHGHICVARDAAAFSAGGGKHGGARAVGSCALPQDDPEASHCCIVLASSVPCYMSAPEFCEFVGAFSECTHRRFRHCRVLHGRNPEEYLIACWLASPADAAAVIREYGGKRYNTIEAGECQLHRVVGCLHS